MYDAMVIAPGDDRMLRDGGERGEGCGAIESRKKYSRPSGGGVWNFKRDVQ